MARCPVAAHAQAMVEPGGRGRGSGRSAGRHGRATGRGGSNIVCAPVSDHVAACWVPAAGGEPLDRRRGVSRRVPAAGAEPIPRRGHGARQMPAAGHGAIPRSSGRGVRGRVPGRGADSGHAAAAIHVSAPSRSAGPGYAAAPRRVLVPEIARRYVPRQPVGGSPRSPTKIVVQGPLPKDWQGFSVKFAESLKGSPAYLRELLRFDGTSRAKKFIRTIREYNCIFAFTSMGATIERSFGGSRGPKIFKISGQVSHHIGSLVPSGDDTPKFVELYIHDPANEIRHRMNALNLEDKPTRGVDESIVVGLRDMLNEFNPLVQTFREASKMIEDHGDEPIEDISIRIIGPSEGDSPQFSLPTTTGLAALVVGGGFTLEASSWDIVVCSRSNGLQQISSLNTAFMPLQYPLLFPYGERGFQVNVPHLIVPEEDDDDGPIDPNLAPGSPTVEASSPYPSAGGDASANSRNRMTMQDYYRFMCHYKGDQPNPYICYGLLSSQSVVDARACIDESRLWYIIRNQDMLRSEHMQGITDAVGDGCVDGDALGKRTIVPSSHIGGHRYFHENFHDGLAVCRVHGLPDIFATFTWNPKWPEITSALEPGQTPSDRAYIVVRVYHTKLTEYLDEIKSGLSFGPITAGIATAVLCV
ncbi:hypothetical protein CFC21_038085 [Triticum aestivum]|uniref:Helitron helicase-like domain-containing protein n=2 Tax=Triticum aestivum TaxID=4565 RepID=A0A3B6EPP6_WHEAT|nr:hypothetical protein CFC21_038085 [Triticum aestivum]